MAPPAFPGELCVPAVLAQAKRENFPVALRVLPRQTRRRLEAVYGFARLVDDAGDVASGDRLALLDWIEADVRRAFEGTAEHPLLERLTPLMRELRLTPEPFLRLVEANRQDQSVTRYQSWRQLEAYCDLSANPVGELVLGVLGAATPERLRRSDAVCTGLQLVEHLQDVGEDLARGRVYLPEEDLQRFQVAETDLRAERPGDALRRLLSFEVERARSLLAEGVALVSTLRGRSRLAVAGYVGGGRAALDAIERSDYDVLRRAPSAGRVARVRAAACVLREAG
ncbi:MAG: squalene synthase HpnC [Actinobacteria bacterium]|nr:squalene synthase HpnC [Actinomycetota bacterium]